MKKITLKNFMNVVGYGISVDVLLNIADWTDSNHKEWEFDDVDSIYDSVHDNRKEEKELIEKYGKCEVTEFTSEYDDKITIFIRPTRKMLREQLKTKWY